MTTRKGTLVAVFGVLLVATGATTAILTSKVRTCPNYAQRVIRKMLRRPDLANAETNFRWLKSSSGRGATGSEFDASVYRTPECIEVERTLYVFDSVQNARGDMERRLQASGEILEHKIPNAGDAASDLAVERAILRIPKGGDYNILTRRANRTLVISSESLPYALEFERRSGA